jgi:hypothetical protein
MVILYDTDDSLASLTFELPAKTNVILTGQVS